jgi:DNA phosphorothioation-associated putative methyltransferase
MLDHYLSDVDLIVGGKRVRGHSYLHVSLLLEQAPPILRIFETARALAGADESTYNVVRISHRSQEVAFLNYSHFFEDPFPALVSSCVVNLVTKSLRRTDFSQRANPNILHRKELLLPSAHPNRPEFEKLTSQLEQYGMFVDILRIGFRKYWMDQLASRGLKVVGHTIVEGVPSPREN